MPSSAHWPARTITAAIFAAAGMTLAGCASGGDSAQSAPASTTPATTTAGQLQDNQCGGMSTDPAAVLTRSADIDIDAPVERVWDVQTDIAKWPEWQDAVLTAERLDPGSFSATSQFRWTTPVPQSQFTPADTLTITSSVRQLKPGECVLWDGPAVGKTLTIDKGTHLWMFTGTAQGTHVHTQESWDAPLLESLKGPDFDAVAAMLGGGLETWAHALKTRAETPAG